MRREEWTASVYSLLAQRRSKRDSPHLLVCPSVTRIADLFEDTRRDSGSRHSLKTTWKRVVVPVRSIDCESWLLSTPSHPPPRRRRQQ